MGRNLVGSCHTSTSPPHSDVADASFPRCIQLVSEHDKGRCIASPKVTRNDGRWAPHLTIKFRHPNFLVFPRAFPCCIDLAIETGQGWCIASLRARNRLLR